MAQKKPHATQDAGHEDRHLHRIEMLSDGVFAIAITLLALEIRVPEGWNGELGAYFDLAGRRLVAYAVGFVTIAAYWTTHRRSLAQMGRADWGFASLNFLQLGCIGLMPAATAMLWEHGSLAAVELYIALVALIGASQGAAWAYACFVGRLVDETVPLPSRLYQLFCMTVLPGATTFLTFYSVATRSAYGWVAIAVLSMAVGLVGRRLRRRRLGEVAPA